MSAPRGEAKEARASDSAKGEATGGGGQSDADVRVIAERVYRLMLAEVRLEQARAGVRPGGR